MHASTAHREQREWLLNEDNKLIILVVLCFFLIKGGCYLVDDGETKDEAISSLPAAAEVQTGMQTFHLSMKIAILNPKILFM